MSLFEHKKSLIYEGKDMRDISNEQFNEKYYTYKTMIYNIAYTYVQNRNDADDIVQDVFMKYLQSNTDFETDRNEKFWLIRVTINTCKSFLSRAWKKKVVLDDEHIAKIGEQLPVSSSQNTFEIIYHLPQKYKEIIILYYIEDLSIQDISEMLHISLSASKKRLERARNMVKKRRE